VLVDVLEELDVEVMVLVVVAVEPEVELEVVVLVLLVVDVDDDKEVLVLELVVVDEDVDELVLEDVVVDVDDEVVVELEALLVDEVDVLYESGPQQAPSAPKHVGSAQCAQKQSWWHHEYLAPQQAHCAQRVRRKREDPVRSRGAGKARGSSFFLLWGVQNAAIRGLCYLSANAKLALPPQTGQPPAQHRGHKTRARAHYGTYRRGRAAAGRRRRCGR